MEQKSRVRWSLRWVDWPSILKEKYVKATPNKCQYCNKTFSISGTLGGHLIRSDKPRKPDGIHNINQIRREKAYVKKRGQKQILDVVT